MSDRPTPGTDAAWQADKDTVFRVETSRKLERERDEARAVAAELAVIASHCLGSHSFALNDTAIKIASALKRWKKSQ